MFVDEHYDGNVKKLYDDYNLTAFRNKNQGLSFKNFVTFIEANNLLFQSYHINSSEQRVLVSFSLINIGKVIFILEFKGFDIFVLLK